jgi:hypothetical protein
VCVCCCHSTPALVELLVNGVLWNVCTVVLLHVSARVVLPTVAYSAAACSTVQLASARISISRSATTAAGVDHCYD